MLGGKPLILGQTLKRPTAGVEFFLRGELAPSPAAEGAGESGKLSQWGLGGDPAAKRFYCIPEAPDGLS